MINLPSTIIRKTSVILSFLSICPNFSKLVLTLDCLWIHKEKDICHCFTIARAFWAAKSGFCSFMQKFLYQIIFCSFCFFAPFVRNHFWIKNLISRQFLKVHKEAFKNFCMERENFCTQQKFYTLVLQPKKTHS